MKIDMTKQNLIKSVVVASLAAATAFSLYKVWKTGRRMYEERQEAEKLDEKREAITRIKDEVKTTIEPDDNDLEPLEDEDEEVTVRTTSDIDDALSSIDVMERMYDVPKDDKEVPGMYMTEEDKKLKYDKDSLDAWKQYVDVHLVGMPKDSETRIVMERLYDEGVVMTDSDDTVESNILDARIDFFGPDSKWVDSPMSIGEILDFFAYKLDYDLGPDYGGKINWLYRLVTNLGLDSSNVNETDFMEELGDEIVNHTFSRYISGIDDQAYGIFSLREDQMTEVSDDSSDKFMQEYWDYLDALTENEDENE